MAGLFPSGGTTPANTRNAVLSPNVLAGCDPLFYRADCNPRFDPVATNAIISELINAVNGADIAYDCSKLDNLQRAIIKLTALCSLPGKVPDTDDFIAGCFDGASGIASMKSILSLAPGIFDLAGISDDDTIGFNENAVGSARKITFGDLKANILGSVPTPTTPQSLGAFRPVSFLGTFVGTGGASGNLSMAGYTAGVCQAMVPNNGNVRFGAASWVPSSTSSGDFNRIAVAGDTGNSNNIHGESTHAFFKAPDGVWWLNHNGLAIALNNGGDIISYDGSSTGGNFQALSVWGATRVDYNG
jgi:hypothetical protein